MCLAHQLESYARLSYSSLRAGETSAAINDSGLPDTADCFGFASQ